MLLNSAALEVNLSSNFNYIDMYVNNDMIKSSERSH